MSTLISVTGLETKTQSSLDWKALTGTLAFDINDISSVIRRDAGNTYSYFEVKPESNPKSNNYSKQEYRVSDSLSAIANQSTGLAILSVTSRRGTAVSYTAVFVVSRMSQRLEVVAGGGTTTRFWYMEDGDALPVEYIVTESIATIIAQTNSSFSFLVRNGVELNSGYVELGGILIHDTEIDLDSFKLDLISSNSGYSTLFRKTNDRIYDQIDNGSGKEYTNETAVSTYVDYKTLVDGVSSYGFGKPSGRAYTEWFYNKTTDSQYAYIVLGEGVGIPDNLANPTFGMYFHVQSSLAGPGAFDMGFYLDEYNGFSIADNKLGATYKHFNVHQDGYSKFQDGSKADNTETSAVLNVESIERGFLPPRMTAVQAEAIASPAEGLLVYATNGAGVTITSKGWWGYSGATWEKLN